MNPETLTIPSSVWLDGNPVFSLTYKKDGGDMFMDVLGFRPNPVDYLMRGVKYSATLLFCSEKDHKGLNTWVLRVVEVDLSVKKGYSTDGSQKFVYIR